MSASYKMLPQLVSPSAQSVRAAQRSVGARRVALFENDGRGQRAWCSRSNNQVEAVAVCVSVP